MLFRLRPNTDLEDRIAARFPGNGTREVGLIPRSRILDVGCGSGELLLLLHAAGFRSLLGIDPYVDRDLVYPGGLRILKRSIHEIDGHWDLVMLHHSLEHMPDQQETLDAVGRLLAPGGWCLIRVPIVSYAWEHYGVDWVQLDAPRHFFLHSGQSLKQVAERAGLKIARTVYDSGSFQFWGSELYRRDIPLFTTSPVDVEARAAAFKREEIEVFEKRGQELNAQHRGDQAAFYLRKVTHDSA
jgi:SAM-dependent methyltransferase